MDLESDYDGITKINVIDWLLRDEKLELKISFVITV